MISSPADKIFYCDFIDHWSADTLHRNSYSSVNNNAILMFNMSKDGQEHWPSFDICYTSETFILTEL